jgi:hypothetical protein
MSGFYQGASAIMGDFRQHLLDSTPRYIVIKKSDLNPDQLERLESRIDNLNIPIRSGIFIDRSWDCYEEAFDLVERHIKKQKSKPNVWVD